MNFAMSASRKFSAKVSMRSSPLEECFDKIQRMAKPIKSKPPTTTLAVAAPPKLLNDLRALISQSRQQVAQAINSVLVMLYWQVGHRIRTDVLREKRADYGKEIVHALSGQLTGEFGNGFGRANLFHMVHFAEVSSLGCRSYLGSSITLAQSAVQSTGAANPVLRASSAKPLKYRS